MSVCTISTVFTVLTIRSVRTIDAIFTGSTNYIAKVLFGLFRLFAAANVIRFFGFEFFGENG